MKIFLAVALIVSVYANIGLEVTDIVSDSFKVRHANYQQAMCATKNVNQLSRQEAERYCK